MVAQGRAVKADLVHQGHHRVGRDLIEVVERLAGAVVPGGDDQQTGIERPHAVHDSGQLREILDLGVHVIGGEDVDFRLFRMRRSAQQAHGAENQKQSFHYFILILMVCPSRSGASSPISCPHVS